MYFYHPPEFNQYYPADNRMYGNIRNPQINPRPNNQFIPLNLYPKPFPKFVHQTSHQPSTHTTLQLPTHPANQQNRQTKPNPVPNEQYKYPPVDADLLNQSANETKKLMAEASMVLNKFATSKEFGEKIMDSAQRSNMEEVKRLISSVGVKSDVKIKYNPDGLHLEFNSKLADCCRLEIVLRWR